MLWPWLDKRRHEPVDPAQVRLGLVGVGFGFFILVIAIRTPPIPASKIVLGFRWRLTYLVHTMAELCLSPIGLSMVTKLAAPKEIGMAMGGWFLSIATANYVAGLHRRHRVRRRRAWRIGQFAVAVCRHLQPAVVASA